jgi:hypothetical protein
LGKLHLANIAIHISSGSEKFLGIARAAISALYDKEAINQFNLIEAFLKFVHEQFALWRETHGWGDAKAASSETVEPQLVDTPVTRPSLTKDSSANKGNSVRALLSPIKLIVSRPILAIFQGRSFH